MTRVTIFGATGRSGSAILAELAADCDVVACVRHPDDSARLPQTAHAVETAHIDTNDPGSIRAAVEGSSVIVNAVRLRGDIPQDDVLDFHQRIMRAVTELGQEHSTHVVIVGGAGTLRLPDGSRFWQNPDFPATPLPRARAHALLRDHLESRQHAYQWAYLVPPLQFNPDGPRTGRFDRWPGQDDESALLTSSISYADFAVAVREAVVLPLSGVWLVGRSVHEQTPSAPSF